MDDEKLTAMQGSLREVRDEVHRALARLDEELSTMNRAKRGVKIEVERVRNAAYEALAELRHLDRQLRTDADCPPRRLEAGGAAAWKAALRCYIGSQ